MHQLNAFLAAVETGSIRAAARKLNLSPAALTKALRELEEELGAQLIRRSVRGIQMTEGGARLHRRALIIATQISQAESEFKQLQGLDQGTVSMAVTPTVALLVLPQAVTAFRRRYRRVALHVVEGMEGMVVPGVRQGSLDFGIMIVSGNSLGEDMTVEPWVTVPNAVVLRQGHPLAGARSLAELADAEWLATSFGNYGLGKRIEKLFGDAGLPPPARVLRCESALAALAIVRQSEVMTLLPAPVLTCAEAAGICAAALDPPPPSSRFCLVTRADVPLTPAAAAFTAILKDMTIRRFTPQRNPAKVALAVPGT
jgi:DNA-binding transcriptional LysR family regulator